jgi:hypothetical protein
MPWWLVRTWASTARLPLLRQDSGNSGGGAAGEASSGEGEGQSGGDASGGETSGSGGEGEGSGAANSGSNDSQITFPNARSFSARLNREVRRLNDQRAVELGFKDGAEMDAFLRDQQQKRDAELSEAERLKKDVATLETRLAEERARGQNALILSKIAAIGVKDEFRLVDVEDTLSALQRGGFVSEEGIHLDATGQVVGVEDALKELLKVKPYLRAGASAIQTRSGSDQSGSNADASNNGKTSMNSLIRQAAGRA